MDVYIDQNLGYYDGHFRRPSGIDAWPDPSHRVFGRSHWHRGAARLQRARFCRRLTGLRAHRAARSCSPSYADVRVYRERQGLDEFQPTPSQPFEYISGVCFFQLRQLRIIRRSLTADAAHALVRALIHTRIDYGNGLLVSCSRYLTDRLQVVLRAAARLVLQVPYRSSVSEIMHRQLHWLDVVDRVNYKIGLLVYKCLHGLAPGYLSDQCVPASTFAGRDNMRSSPRLDRLLYVSRTKTKTLAKVSKRPKCLPSDFNVVPKTFVPQDCVTISSMLLLFHMRVILIHSLIKLFYPF